MTRHAIVIGSLVMIVALGGSSRAFAQTDNPQPAAKPADQPAASATDQNDRLPTPKTTAAPLFITGAYGTGMDRSSHFVTNQPGGLQTNLSGNMPNRMFGVGTFVTPHWSVRFEMALPATLHVNSSSSGGQVVQSLRVAQTQRTAYVMFGYHTAPRRVRAEYLGGVAFISQRQNSISQVFDLNGVPMNAPMETDAYSYKSTAVAGVDVSVALGRYFAVVPGLRAWSMGGTFSLRSAIGFRVIF
jgi:hypothetical protein